ncbi:phage adsorption protein NrfB [Shimwellia pseudoproteus]|uniref:glycosyltransferase n=1 Tax=Shimwellia pseudoproteus TaxID=570012 RepID=UPI0018EC954D|nr:glycosyltransferase [Shimwellia pseudoproteus]MBJ3816862.1 phage adsorption protein NrfB [Shimwellia pseudoproteus]
MISLIDTLTTWLYFLKIGLIILASLMLINGLDDLLVDILYWCRKSCRSGISRPVPFPSAADPREKPLAILIPTWQEAGVIGQMLRLATRELDYENYHIFVGTYRDDPATTAEVQEICAAYSNVHHVECVPSARPSKAVCLNSLLDAVFGFERQASFTFAGFVLHGAQDVVMAQELKLFGQLVGYHDVVRIPIYPYARRWYQFSGLSYIDKFAELQGKLLPVRAALTGQVTRTGAGCCISRRAIMALLEEGDGVAFNIDSMAVDYETGFILRRRGMREIFCRMKVPQTGDRFMAAGFLTPIPQLMCVRRYLPGTFCSAVRQKARWNASSAFQGHNRLRWSQHLWPNYFLWRDRKGVLVSALSLLIALCLLQLGAVWVYEHSVADAWHFLGVFSASRLLMGLLVANGVLLLNRIIQRALFVAVAYGVWQGVGSVARLFWSLVVSISAWCCAIWRFLTDRDMRKWIRDKSHHSFPAQRIQRRDATPLGQILIAQGVITPAQLEESLSRRINGVRLGSSMVRQGVITPQQLASALAHQAGISAEDVDCRKLDPQMIKLVPARVALHYAVLPLRTERGTLIVARESPLDPVSLAAMARKIGMPVKHVIAPPGQVVVGVRRWYSHRREDHYACVVRAVEMGLFSAVQGEQLWQQYVAGQVLFAEVLISQAYINPSVLHTLLLRYEHSDLMFGEFLVEENVVSEDAVANALRRQRQMQPTMEGLFSQQGINHFMFAALSAGAL